MLKQFELGEYMRQLGPLLFRSLPLRFQFSTRSLKLDLQSPNLIPERLVLAHKLPGQLPQSHLLFLQSYNESGIAMFC